MSRAVRLRPEAEAEIAEAASWYSGHGSDLAAAFLDEVARTLATLRDDPLRFPVVIDPVRKAPLRRFPYIVLFRVTDAEALVISCFHTRRDPKEWRGRL